MPLEYFSADTRAWFGNAFDAPTAAQEQAWPAISRGEHVRIDGEPAMASPLAGTLTELGFHSGPRRLTLSG